MQPTGPRFESTSRRPVMPHVRAAASMARMTSSSARPWPPYSREMAMPIRPSATSVFTFSHGYSSRSSQPAARSRNSPSARARTRAWRSACSVVRGNFTPASARRDWARKGLSTVVRASRKVKGAARRVRYRGAVAEREPPRVPVAGAVAVLLVLASAILVTQFPLISSRPENPEKLRARSLGLQDVDARLWQDPFSAAAQHQDDKDASAPEHRERHDPWHVKAQVLDRDVDGMAAVVGVTVFGGPYPEDAESRRRTRYAVLSGLNVAGFVPDDAEHLGYFVLNSSAEDRQGFASPPWVVPYEWLSRERGTPRHVLLLWLNEGNLAGHPLFAISRVVDAVDPTGAARRAGGIYARGCSPTRPRPAGRVKIIGPAGSSTLRDMIDEARIPEQNWCLANVEFYAATATVSDAELVGSSDTAADVLDRYQNIKLLRTLIPDAALMRALVDELRARGVDPVRAGPTGRQHVALIAEWDTLYSQALGQALESTVCAELAPRDAAAEKACRERLADPQRTWIHRFSYLPGLDGALATRPPGQPADSARKSDTGRFGLEEVRERAELGSQFDYLRRLADRMREKESALQASGQGFAAIGVLGSDLYDKLLVLQAVRAQFPRSVFFTTDLDARL